MKYFLCLYCLFNFLVAGLSQCPDTLKLYNFPCCISGMDWSESDQRLYLVSDVNNFVYVAKVNLMKKLH